jgi:hypothetical protein
LRLAAATADENGNAVAAMATSHAAMATALVAANQEIKNLKKKIDEM